MAEAEPIGAMIAVAGAFATIILSIVCITLYGIVKVVRETSLKQRLIEAGLTATEIEVVLSAGNGKRDKTTLEKPIVAKKTPPKAAAYT